MGRTSPGLALSDTATFGASAARAGGNSISPVLRSIIEVK